MKNFLWTSTGKSVAFGRIEAKLICEQKGEQLQDQYGETCREDETETHLWKIRCEGRQKEEERKLHSQHGETCGDNDTEILPKVDYRIQGLRHAAVEQEDDARKELVSRLVDFVKSHPFKEARLQPICSRITLFILSAKVEKMIYFGMCFWSWWVFLTTANFKRSVRLLQRILQKTMFSIFETCSALVFSTIDVGADVNSVDFHSYAQNICLHHFSFC